MVHQGASIHGRMEKPIVHKFPLPWIMQIDVFVCTVCLEISKFNQCRYSLSELDVALGVIWLCWSFWDLQENERDVIL